MNLNMNRTELLKGKCPKNCTTVRKGVVAASSRSSLLQMNARHGENSKILLLSYHTLYAETRDLGLKTCKRVKTPCRSS